jgi:hypothetical protein
MKNLSIAAILGCFLAGGYCCIKCDAQIANPGSAPPQGVTVSDPAEVLVRQLSARTEVRENAAKALEAMGTSAAKALVDYINNNLTNVTEIQGIQGITKATTVLGKIGRDVADDEEVRKALVSAAKMNAQADDWPRLQLQLAAIDALGEINKYRGSILPKKTASSSQADGSAKPSESAELAKAKTAADNLAETAKSIFNDAIVRPVPTPTPTPDKGFRDNLLALHGRQRTLIKLVSDVNPEASPPKKKASEASFSKLKDAKSLATCLRKIQVAYLDATKTNFSEKPADQADDKSRWQLKAEAAYDLLTETKQLSDQLQKLDEGFRDLTKNRGALSGVVSELGGISKEASSYLVKAAVGNALNAIFSEPPKKKPAAEGAKKDQTKKDSGKKEDEKKATDKKDSDKKDSNNSEVEEDETANE